MEENPRLGVENFGPIRKAEIELKPLTILVGQNNTGKSYLALMVYALSKAFSQMYESEDSYILMKEGPHRVYRSYSNIRMHLPDYVDRVSKLDKSTLDVFEQLIQSERGKAAHDYAAADSL